MWLNKMKLSCHVQTMAVRAQTLSIAHIPTVPHHKKMRCHLSYWCESTVLYEGRFNLKQKSIRLNMLDCQTFPLFIVLGCLERKISWKCIIIICVYVFSPTLLLCAGVFSLPILSYLPYSHTADSFFTVLACGLCLGTAARALLAGLPDVISSNCRLLSSFRSSIILLTGMLHLVPLGCAFSTAWPQLSDRQVMW